MRTKSTFLNLVSHIGLQITVVITGFLTTNLFMAYYGSTISGMVSAVDQIITALSIIEAGVGTAAILALYEPLKNYNKEKIGKILGAARNFYYKSGVIYVFIIIILVFFYPMLIENQVDTYSVRLIIVILSLGNIIDYFLFGKYRILLTADQKLYVLDIFQGISTIVSTIAIVVLIQNEYSYIVVKSVGAILLIIRFLAVKVYFYKKYPDIKISNNYKDVNLSQRWGAFVHIIATIIVFNTDLFILTIFLGASSLISVNIYRVYNLVTMSLVNLISSLNAAFTPSFGNLLLENDKNKIRKVFQSFEFISFFIVFVLNTCLLLVLKPFISVYTKNVTDANYVDIYLVILFTLISVLQGIRIPGLTMISAKGHFKETQLRAIFEAILNLILSLILVQYIGMYGVLLGTVISFLYRTVDIVIYNSKYIISNTLKLTVKRIFLNIIIMLVLYFLISSINITVDSYLSWFIYSSVVGIIVIVSYIIFNLVFERVEVMNFYERVRSIVKGGN